MKRVFILILFCKVFVSQAQQYDTVYKVRYDTMYVLRSENNAALDSAPSSSVSLLDELDAIQGSLVTPPNPKKIKVYSTFGGTHLINGQTVETINKKTMAMIISHRFGRVNAGWREFFGLDQASIRLGFEYGILDNLTVGLGRNTYNKTFDGYVKYRFLEQKQKGMPLSMCFYSNMAISTAKYKNQARTNYFSSRLSYTFQLMIARKFNDWFSLQLMPTVTHKNLVTSLQEKNTMFVLGTGVRVKLSKRMHFMAEYYARIGNKSSRAGYQDAFALGLDVVTGGHVFQFQITNAQAMYETGFMRETTGKFWKGDIHIGFNISRTWGVGKKAKQERKEKKAKKKLAQQNGSTSYH
ncbi:MAG: hypothetical protein IPP60_04245 [Sphingobacteriales bacterium]|nr:hypothetical protein [Sphingobacteriales bacterium]